jgi:outer membrane protein OmpA-like peptidoglycan-associated protein
MPDAGPAKLLSYGLQLSLSLAPPRVRHTAKPKGQPVVQPEMTKEPPVPDTTSAMPSYYDSLGINYDDAAFIEQPVIFGAVDEVAIPQVGKVHLDKAAAILMQHPKIRISLVGHICSSETETEDPKVASARVKAVTRYLMSKGVRRNRMDVSALKESDPVQPNNPPANYRRRRVAITVE